MPPTSSTTTTPTTPTTGSSPTAPTSPATHGSAPERHLPLTGVANFRDLGGYPVADGRTTRWRTMFRADGLGQLTADDVTILRDLELRTVLDLRTPVELDERGRYPVESHPVRFHHVSLIDRTWDVEQARAEDLPPAEFLHRQYTAMLAESGDRFAAALTLLADRDAVPAVFHCAAGKDRTGLLAMLVLGSLGVDRATIVADYALTAVAMSAILERAADDPDKAARLAEVPRTFFSAEPDGMDRTVADLERDHGSIRDYVRWIGVDDEAVEHLEHLLLEG